MAIQPQTGKKGTGTKKETLWELVKFTMVSMLAMVVSFGSLNIFIHLPFIRDLFGTPFNWFVFNYPVITNTAGVAVSGALGYFIAFNTSNTLAQIVAFFVNRDKTFKSSANIAITLPIYIVFTIALICFSAWLSPQLNAFAMGKSVFGIEIGEGLAANIANMGCSFIQFILYFPVDKILFRKPKEQKAA